MMRPCAKDCQCQACTYRPSPCVAALGPEAVRLVRVQMAHAIHDDWMSDRAALRARRGKAFEVREALAYVRN